MTERAWQAEVDAVDKNEWSRILPEFADAFIYQSWSYGATRWGEQNLSHLVLKRDGEVRAAAQVRIVKAPLAPVGIAYVTWGPVWRRRGEPDDPDTLREIYRALRDEYVRRRRLFLRIIPADVDTGDDSLRKHVEAEGFHWSPNPYRTFLVDLSRSLEDVRRSLRKTWRQTLAKAERADLEVVQGTSVEMFNEGVALYEEMHQRKGFAEFVDMTEFARIQADMPDHLKMQVSICRANGEPVSALAWSAIGDTAMPTLAATSPKAMKLNASYLLFWTMIEWLKDNGQTCLDLGGVSKERNPGGYTFKSGLAGKKSEEAGLIGQFEAWGGWASRLAVRCADGIRNLRQRLKRAASASFR